MSAWDSIIRPLHASLPTSLNASPVAVLRPQVEVRFEAPGSESKSSSPHHSTNRRQGPVPLSLSLPSSRRSGSPPPLCYGFPRIEFLLEPGTAAQYVTDGTVAAWARGYRPPRHSNLGKMPQTCTPSVVFLVSPAPLAIPAGHHRSYTLSGREYRPLARAKQPMGVISRAIAGEATPETACKVQSILRALCPWEQPAVPGSYFSFPIVTSGHQRHSYMELSPVRRSPGVQLPFETRLTGHISPVLLLLSRTFPCECLHRSGLYIIGSSYRRKLLDIQTCKT